MLSQAWDIKLKQDFLHLESGLLDTSLDNDLRSSFASQNSVSFHHQGKDMVYIRGPQCLGSYGSLQESDESNACSPLSIHTYTHIYTPTHTHTYTLSKTFRLENR